LRASNVASDRRAPDLLKAKSTLIVETAFLFAECAGTGI
jgi:hypothetical protein